MTEQEIKEMLIQNWGIDFTPPPPEVYVLKIYSLG